MRTLIAFLLSKKSFIRVFGCAIIIVITLELTALLTMSFLLARSNAAAIDQYLNLTSRRLIASINAQLNNTVFDLRRSAAFSEIDRTPLSPTEYSIFLQAEYKPQKTTIDTYGFISIVQHADKEKFERYCRAEILANCTITEFNATTQQIEPAKMKDMYLPISLIYPPVFGDLLVGLDFTSLSPTVSQDILTTTTRNISASGSIGLARPDKSNADSRGVLLAFPVFNSTTTVITGFHVAIIRITDLLNESFQRIAILRQMASIAVFDVTAVSIGTGNLVLYRDKDTSLAHAPIASPMPKHGIVASVSISNRVWQVQMRFSDAFKRERSNNLPFTLPIALSCIFLLADCILIVLIALNGYQMKTRLTLKENKRINSMLSYVSHEMRNPLNLILHLSSYTLRKLKQLQSVSLNNKEVLDMAIRDLTVVSRSCDMLEHIVSDSLVIQKLENGDLHLNNKLCDIQEILNDLCIIVRQKAEEKSNVKLLVSYTGNGSVYVDGFRLKQILLNYLMNSLKYTEKGSITLGVTELQGYYQFYVHDTGSGIPESQFHQIFKAHANVDKDDVERHASFGLGLYLVQMLSKCMNARVGFTSVLGNGSTFYIDIPNHD